MAYETWLVSLLGLALGCSPEPSELALSFSELGDEVERDGWLDGARTLAGDGATSFDSFPASGRPGGAVASARPSFVEPRFDAAPLTSRVGSHLLSLSRFRGLVSTRVVGSDAPRVESSVPLGGLPVGLVVSDGVAAALVLDPLEQRCRFGVDDGSGCVEHQTSRLVLVDVQDPANPRALGEQRFEGAVYAARQVGSTLHLLTRQIVNCYECLPGETTPWSWLAFDRSVPGELRPPRVTPTPGDAFFEAERLFMLTPGVVVGTGVGELRVAELSEPEATLSAPVALGSSAALAIASGDRLRAISGGESVQIETFALGPGGVVLLGRGALALPAGEASRRFLIEGDRGAALLEPSGKLAVLELSDPNAPRVTSLLDPELAEGELVLAGDRVLALGRSTRAVDARPDDVVEYGPQAVVLVDIANPAAPRILDRQTLGSFNSVRGELLELRGERALVSYYEEFPTGRGGAEPEGGSCGRSNLRLVGYELSAGQLSPAFAFDWLDTGARVEPVGDDWW
ncbi:MAG TPA: hypothetical protein VNN80_12610, partial [Polyangiaceae bacterium]|nr:hypothetical protein [Polyangiaceae bacterium]